MVYWTCTPPCRGESRGSIPRWPAMISGSSMAERPPVKRMVEGSSPSPGVVSEYSTPLVGVEICEVRDDPDAWLTGKIFPRQPNLARKTTCQETTWQASSLFAEHPRGHRLVGLGHVSSKYKTGVRTSVPAHLFFILHSLKKTAICSYVW